MAATLTLISQNVTSGDPYNNGCEVQALVNFGNPYAALSKADLLALVNAAIAAVRPDLSVADIAAVLPSASQDGLLFVNWDETNERLEGSVLNPGTASAIPTYAESLGVVPAAHVVAVPAGRILLHATIATAGGGGKTGPVKIGNVAPALTLEGNYDPAAGTLTLLNTDDALTVDLGCLVPGTASVVPSLAAAAGDLSAAAKSFACLIACTRA